MYAPTLFDDRSRRDQIVAAIVLPAVLGGVEGVLIGASAAVYWIVAVIAAVGALLSGFEHLTAVDAARRGAAAGAVYGVALLVLHAIVDTHARVSLGSFPPLLILITALLGGGLAALGVRLAPARTPSVLAATPQRPRSR